MRKYILSLDQGTTSSRSILFDSKSNIIYSSQQEFRQLFPQSGWVEHDPLELLESQKKTFIDVFDKLIDKETEIIALGITNQRETIVAWSKSTGKPFYNAIVWQDSRTSNYCRELVDRGHAELIQQKTGLVLDSYFSASKMNWILKNVPSAQEALRNEDLLFGTIDTWLVWNLTERKSFVTDASNASRTLLFNINTGTWDQELCDLFEIPMSCLAEVKNSSDDFGTVLFNGINIPIHGVAGDQQAALFGQCCFSTGMAKNTYGTGCFMLMNTGNTKIASSHGLLTTVAWKLDNQITYALEGSVFVAGSAIQWLRDGLQIIENAQESEGLALKANPNNEVYVVPAFAGLGAPYWDMYARGGILGLTRDVGIAEITKATLDSLAYQSKDVLEAMSLDANIDLKELKVDGGACANNYLMQFQADILQRTIDRPVCKESTALGAAYLAGIYSGFWTFDELKNVRATERLFHPIMDVGTSTHKYEKWLKAVDRIKDWSA